MRILSSCLAAFMLASCAQGSDSFAEAKQLVALWDSDEGGFDTLAALEPKKCEALPLIAQRLQPTSRAFVYSKDQKTAPDAVRLAADIAALRYLTGHDIVGHSTHVDWSRYTEQAPQFLTMELPPGQIRIFASWPSRGTLYFAPRKAQEEVISEWRNFLDGYDCKQPTPAYAKEWSFWFAN